MFDDVDQKTMTKQTPQRMLNRALFYLQRFSATEKHLGDVLQRQLDRKRRQGDNVPDDADTWVSITVQKCVELGFVNDRAFAESRINRLRREGRSTTYMQQHLAQKGVAKDIIQALLLDTSPEDELEAAKRCVVRKRLGRDHSPEARQKDLAKLARAGFSFDIAKRALDAKDT